MTGRSEGEGMFFTVDPIGGALLHEVLVPAGDDGLVIEEGRAPAGTRVIELDRAARR